MGSEEIKDKNMKSNSEKDNFFIRNIHLLIAVLWGLCALGVYFYNY